MSYEDASLLNDLGVGADKAYEQTFQADDSRLLLKGNKDQGFVELGLFSYPSTMQVRLLKQVAFTCERRFPHMPSFQQLQNTAICASRNPGDVSGGRRPDESLRLLICIQVIYQQSLDGDSESLQPKLTKSPPLTYTSFDTFASMDQGLDLDEVMPHKVAYIYIIQHCN